MMDKKKGVRELVHLTVLTSTFVAADEITRRFSPEMKTKGGYFSVRMAATVVNSLAASYATRFVMRRYDNRFMGPR